MFRKPKPMEVWINRETQNLFVIEEFDGDYVTYRRCNTIKGQLAPLEFHRIAANYRVFKTRYYFSH